MKAIPDEFSRSGQMFCISESGDVFLKVELYIFRRKFVITAGLSARLGTTFPDYAEKN